MEISRTASTTTGDVDAPLIRVPSVIRCGLLIAAVRLALRLLGFGPTIHRVLARADSAPVMAGADITLVRATERAVALAGAIYPGRALCLEQSLVLYYLLRRQGVGVHFHLGVQPHPFAAHAWVALNGAPLNDDPEHVRHFVIVPELP